MKVFIGVNGSAISYKRKSERWSGQSEYYKITKFFCSYADEVYIISLSDWVKLSKEEKHDIDPRGVLRDSKSEIEFAKIDKKRHFFDKDGKQDYLFDVVKSRGEKLVSFAKDCDFGIVFWSQGCFSATTLPGYLYTKRDANVRASVLEMTLNYSSQIAYFLNESKLPWYLIATDPRYVRNPMYPRDIYNLPREIIGQFNEDIEWEHIKTWTKQPLNYEMQSTTVKHVYRGIEKMNLLFEEKKSSTNERNIDFTIVSAQVATAGTPAKNDYRYMELKEWILDPGIECSIYGRWDEEKKVGYPQFKGFLENTNDLDEIFLKTKCSFILPTKAGWMTSKAAELLSLGVLPFYHPNYDYQNNSISKDSPLRVKSPQELKEKISYYSKNENERIELVEKLKKEYVRNPYTDLKELFKKGNK